MSSRYTAVPATQVRAETPSRVLCTVRLVYSPQNGRSRKNFRGRCRFRVDPFVVGVKEENERKESPMPQYAILLYAPTPADWTEAPPEELEAHNRYAAQIEELGGRIVGAQALEPSTTATSIRGDVVTDGPFVESKEVLGGFTVIEARDLDHALEIARLSPATRRGGVEVRPLLG